MKRRAAEPAKLELTSPEALKRFQKAAEAFNLRATRTKAAARKILVDEGIYTRSGKLSRHYS